MEKTQTNIANLDDLIFEGRNKNYGAYEIRRKYDTYLLLGLLFALSGFLLFTAGPVIWEMIKPEEIVEEQQIVTVDPKMIEPPPINPKTPPPPPLPASPPPPKVSTVRFVPPEVAPDEEIIEEDPPKQEELKEVVAGTETVQGDPEADPNELSLDQAGTGEVIGGGEEEAEVLFAEQDPVPPGGDLTEYFVKNIKYPQKAINQDVEGKVFVTFVITSKGDVDDVKLLKGIGYGCDEEALRVVKAMPKWTPGKNNGREVKVRMNIPIVFRLAK
jgi:protein TonB